MQELGNASSEMAFFHLLVRCGSLSATARELGLTTPAVSRRLALLEQRLGVQLLNRTTRRNSLTPEGEEYLVQARRILADIEDVEHNLRRSMAEPLGLLRVNATLGFGRSHIAPVISRFCKTYPQVQIQFHLSVTPPPLTDDAFDVCIRFGEPPDARVIARKVAANRRLLCAAPAYLERHGTPRVPADLARHQCISIHHGQDAYGIWRLSAGRRTESVKVAETMVTNDGDIAVAWALDGHGILMRAEWDIDKYLRSGRLRQVLEQYSTPPADIYAVYPSRHQKARRVTAFVDFLCAELGQATPKARASPRHRR
ncbi:LysR family transcriptional regulator [Alicycliphilus denitrificans]|uniref:Transcriptional regulator, LysR family n=1 Tax=Alicycliphilus denitrificans (strain DSM 14773 / CIP 107495 / K601) TaxID=596154 RepID=F4GCS8_ALIDK|nr:LysR family transcriptional regulator [Alicycliphilus denitrificans]AEB82531.1 transcriptional regulator, LysR family [Alicycliphilus denitrificans K601]